MKFDHLAVTKNHTMQLFLSFCDQSCPHAMYMCTLYTPWGAFCPAVIFQTLVIVHFMNSYLQLDIIITF